MIIHSLISPRLLNVGIRGISMISRFLLIIILAKLLPLSDLGIYGLLVAGIGFAVLFVGFDYYSYSNRELLSVHKDEWSKIIVNQIYAYLPLYLLFIPIAMVVHYYKLLPSGYFIWFIVLMVIEHISIEQNRLLNTMQKQLSASMVLFLRSGAWVLFMLPLIIYIDSFRNLETVLYAWLTGGLASISFATFAIKNSVQDWHFIKPNYGWILKGYKIGLLFILGTVTFRAISTGDRFLLEQMSDVSMVGIYVFYVSLTVGATAFIHAGVIVFSTPKIVTAFQEGEVLKFKYLMKRFLKELMISIVVMVLSLYLFIPFIIEWIDKVSYLDHYDVFYIIMSTAGVTVLNSHPSTYLYASRRDKYTLLSNFSAFIMFTLLSVFFYFNDGEYTPLYKVAISVLITFTWLLFIRYVGYFYYSKSEEGR